MRTKSYAAAAVGALVVVSTLAVTAPASAVNTPVTKASSPWHQYDTPVQGQANLVSVAATSRDNAWAAGFSVKINDAAAARPDATAPADDECFGGTAFPSLMLHWDGSAWRQVPVPLVGRINQVSASGPDDAWASADCGLLHWDGKSWTSIPYAPIPGAQQSSNGAIRTLASDDAWLAGGTYDSATGVEQAFVQHWNGRRWKIVPLPDLGDDFTLNGIDALGADDVWVAGTDYTGNDVHAENVLLLHWNGKSWQRLPAPATGEWTQRVSQVRALARDDVWIAGWGKQTPEGAATRRSLILHWDGNAWTNSPVPDGPGELMDIARVDGAMTAVGDTFSPSATTWGIYILRKTANGWQSEPAPVDGLASLYSLAPIPGGGAWSVGASGDMDPILPLLFRRDQHKAAPAAVVFSALSECVYRGLLTRVPRPCHELVEHGGDVLGLRVARREVGVVLEVIGEGQRDRRGYAGDRQVTQDLPQVFDGADAALDAVADEPGGLAVPLGVQEVDGVFQRAGDRAVVLRGHEDEGVE